MLLHGQTLKLTAVTATDAAIFARWQEDTEFLRNYQYRPAYPQSEAQIAKWLEEAQKERNDFMFGIRLRDSNELIGLLNLDGVAAHHGSCWIAIGFGDRANWGKGYGTEAMQLALEFAFQELNLHRVTLTVFQTNERAIKLYEKIGFVREGVEREAIQREGKRYDVYVYGLLRPEWLTNHGG